MILLSDSRLLSDIRISVKESSSKYPHLTFLNSIHLGVDVTHLCTEVIMFVKRTVGFEPTTHCDLHLSTDMHSVSNSSMSYVPLIPGYVDFISLLAG